jgi:hypothetical protein
MEKWLNMKERELTDGQNICVLILASFGLQEGTPQS